MIITDPKKYGLPDSWSYELYTEPGQTDELGDSITKEDYQSILRDIEGHYPRPFKQYNINIIDFNLDIPNSECIVDVEQKLNDLGYDFDDLEDMSEEEVDNLNIPLFDEYIVPITDIVYDITTK